ncbi:hypothetical protein [Actinoplanes subglobosus]|uniref:Uncharacterized protein n=1 Tax=Actinoplanes subglobosus TaxID=1547892 RepID=A0ABV8IZW1_9ACTN
MNAIASNMDGRALQAEGHARQLSRLSGVYSPAWSAVGGSPTSDHRLVGVDPAIRC